MFVKGHVYRRRSLHDLFGGQQQGGISTPSEHKLMFLFTGERGEDHGYSDDWTDNQSFLYTGEGQRGDMAFLRGNKAIRDHLKDGKEIHLFAQKSQGFVEYIGQMVCNGHHFKDGSDTDGNIRRMIIFELSRVE